METTPTPTPAPAEDMVTAYLLRDIPRGPWDAARARAERDGVSIRVALLALIGAYSSGDVRLKLTATRERKAG